MNTNLPADTPVDHLSTRSDSPRRRKLTYLAHKPALELLDLINKKLLNPQNLHKPERRNIVDMLRADGWGQAKIAGVLKCSHRTVRADVRVLKNLALPLVKQFTRELVAAESIKLAETVRLKAIAANKLELAWQITKELPELMQACGVADWYHKAPTEVKGKLTLEELVAESRGSEALDQNGVVAGRN